VSDIVPFLAAIAAQQVTTRPMLLPSMDPVLAGPDPGALEAERAAAIAAGREAGLRETAALRAKLAGLVEAMRTTREAKATELAELVATAATSVIEAYLGTIPRADMFAPVIRGWLAGDASAAGTVTVHPSDIDATRAAIGDAPLVVVGDATVKAGDIAVASPTRELTIAWQTRLDELRSAITAELAAAHALQ